MESWIRRKINKEKKRENPIVLSFEYIYNFLGYFWKRSECLEQIMKNISILKMAVLKRKGTKKMGKKKMYRSMIIHVECGATTISEKGKRVDSRNSLAGSTTNSSITKRTKNKKRRETQQEFTHSWVVGTLKGHTGTIFNMSFSSNGKLLASCAEDAVFIWCTKNLTSKARKSLRINLEYDYAIMIRWSPDGKAFIIHKSLQNIIEVYKVTKKIDGFIASATKVLEFPQKHIVNPVGLDIACTGRYIMSCSEDNDLIIWDLKGQPLATIELKLGSTHRARISPCGRFITTSGFTPDTNVWEVVFSKTGDFKQVSKAFDLTGHSSGVYDFNYNADTSCMATLSKDGTYRVYNTKIEFEKGEDPHLITTGTWEVTTPANIALSPNGEVLVITHGSSLSFYNTITGALDNTIKDIFSNPITCVTFDALGEYVLVSGDKHIKIFCNVTGYRAAITSAKYKLKQRQTSATRERLEKIITDAKRFLEEMGEECSE
ncbi:transducin beta-like protein 2 isoform X7 [Vespula pensylvanica]|uniref:transducin beta-like protein 2 isoform X7 n=1 Tax=Vespula pensylvanica TaxID=30213 RepID=UPI001CBA49DA|nr:transducin beta-like protein 2 isoform X7 [Vespula pensylvanica]